MLQLGGYYICVSKLIFKDLGSQFSLPWCEAWVKVFVLPVGALRLISLDLIKI
jgi:hypothetical protein